MIYGGRIRQAREFRGLTQTALAKAIDKDQSAVTRIEAGEFQPSADIITALAATTEFPSEFFSQPPGIVLSTNSLLFRKHASVTSRRRQIACRYGEIAIEAIAIFSQRVRRPPVTLPRNVGGDPTLTAREVRKALGIGPAEPIRHLTRAVERAGVLVVQIPLDDDEIDAFSSWDYHEEATPVIVLPSGKSGARLRLSVAHDVGHLALHPVPHKTAAEIEKEAFAFSAELLMPAAVMLHEIRRPVTLTTLAQLSPQWGVSVQALVRRARDLEIISQRQYTYLFEQIGALGWKRKEPIFIAAERPRAVRKIAELRYGDPPDYRRMASDANLPTKFIKALVEGHATR